MSESVIRESLEPDVHEEVDNVAQDQREPDDMDDLFGDDNDEQKEEDDQEDEEDEGSYGGHRTSYIDEEEAMYNRKFYGEEGSDMSDHEEEALFKEADVELVRHVVPYKTFPENEDDKTIYYTKVPAFLSIDPLPFDPPSFENKVKERTSNFSSVEDQLGDRLIDENTIRWRYSRDAEQRVFKESNAQIVQWSDGSYSLKLGAEYTDILVNGTDNTFLTVSHDQQELMQCVDGGQINKTLIFIPTSTNSKIHQRLSKAIARRDQRVHSGPGTMIVNLDPEVEKRELEKKQTQIIRERRRRQMKEQERLESPELGAFSHSNRRSQTPSQGYERTHREDEYEEDDFLVDDDEEDESVELESGADEEDDEEEEEAQFSDEDEARAERLKEMKRSNKVVIEEENDENSPKRRKGPVISDDEDED
ncbi:hypothetical protein KAFR_0D05050 [Kazachstania africana CBS 2517]|uniref:Leo1-like protein n=1 Tax=Kazachstania africana (strain ATCC 22294 / BCRC 22015 / CBS 2517 / CECT 1963 / NBRC 1671 / NRRL Y-8276) TaxID=1071382 RepID=H2AUV2_KAZAF|nr:hypothetical protein KAFR_0D05050 [Kazachstania africana CBS 2517]CCF58152.1 hypothetical protein KAFR_0D05050 [Kazachstania africana CBS 2517]